MCYKRVMENGNNKIWVSAQMTKLLKARLREMAREQDVTVSEIVRRACELYLAGSGLETALGEGYAAWIKHTEQQAH